jgi:hypothetical protein
VKLLNEKKSVPRDRRKYEPSAEYVVSEILLVIEKTFGKEIILAMESLFERTYNISVRDRSIFDYPDRFAEALLHVFGVGREPILRLINERLVMMVPIEDQNAKEELVQSGAYGYVYLINEIKKYIKS